MNDRVSSLLEQFKSHFRSDRPASIPLSLRQESSSIVFVSLLEEDRGPDSDLLGQSFGLNESSMAPEDVLGGLDLRELLSAPGVGMEPGAPDATAGMTMGSGIGGVQESAPGPALPAGLEDMLI